MADPALDSHPDTIEHLFAEWDRYPTATPAQFAAREDYARREMERCIAAGIAPLYAALSAPLADQQDAAVRALLSMGHGSVTLRLREGVEPHPADPQGRLLKGEDKGKLRVKVGNLQRFANAPLRLEASNRGHDLYRCVDVSATPSSFSLDDAVKVWRQWGYRFRPSEMSNERSTWLVVQVRQDGKPFGTQPANQDKRK